MTTSKEPPSEETSLVLPKEMLPSSILADARKIKESAETHEKYRRAANTLRARAADMRIFEKWCAKFRLASTFPVPSDTITAFLFDMADGISSGKPRKASTVRRYLATLSALHGEEEYPSPWRNRKVRDCITAIQRKKAEAPVKKRALTDDLLLKVVPKIGNTLRGLRNKAILLVGVFSSLRRSELVALDVENIRRGPKGVFLYVAKSKTDQSARGREVALRADGTSLCPVNALFKWLRAAKIRKGAIFRQVWRDVVKERISDDTVARVVKESVARAGLPPNRFAGHSMRSGYITSASEAGVDLMRIVKQTGQTTATAAKYIQLRDLMGDESPAAKIVQHRKAKQKGK